MQGGTGSRRHGAADRERGVQRGSTLLVHGLVGRVRGEHKVSHLYCVTSKMCALEVLLANPMT